MRSIFVVIILSILMNVFTSNAQIYNKGKSDNHKHAKLKGEPQQSFDIITALKRLDLSRLSRLLALTHSLKYPDGVNFSLANGWNHAAENSVAKRLAIYGYALAYKTAASDGKCLFHSIAASLENGGFTIGKIKASLGTSDINRGTYEAIMATSNDGRYFTQQQLQRIAIIGYLGFDPDVKESIKEFNNERLVVILKRMQDLEDPFVDGERFTSVYNITYFIDKLKSQNTLAPAAELFQYLLNNLSGRWGDYFDIFSIETALNIKVIPINVTTGCFNCSILQIEKPVSIVALLHYSDGLHFNTAGIVDVSKGKDILPISSFAANDIPLALAIMITDDCRIQREL